MTAYKAMVEILNINEQVEKLKAQNSGNIPNLESCELCELLENYRELLVAEMSITELNAFAK